MAVPALNIPEKVNFDRRKSSNALSRAARDSEKQHSATVDYWLRLADYLAPDADYLAPDNVRSRSKTLATRVKESRMRAEHLRMRSRRLIQKSRALRGGLPARKD